MQMKQMHCITYIFKKSLRSVKNFLPQLLIFLIATFENSTFIGVGGKNIYYDRTLYKQIVDVVKKWEQKLAKPPLEITHICTSCLTKSVLFPTVAQPNLSSSPFLPLIFSHPQIPPLIYSKLSPFYHLYSPPSLKKPPKIPLLHLPTKSFPSLCCFRHLARRFLNHTFQQLHQLQPKTQKMLNVSRPGLWWNSERGKEKKPRSALLLSWFSLPASPSKIQFKRNKSRCVL